MKIFKKNIIHGIRLVLILCMISSALASTDALMDALNANRITRQQKRLMKRMMKLHHSLKSIDPSNTDPNYFTDKKNTYMKQFRQNKQVKISQTPNQMNSNPE